MMVRNVFQTVPRSVRIQIADPTPWFTVGVALQKLVGNVQR